MIANKKTLFTGSKAIKESVQIMDPDEEYITIASAEEQMSLTEAARKKELDEARSKMKGTAHGAVLWPWC